VSRNRDDDGRYLSDASLADVLAVFDEVDGPTITTADVVDSLGCSREVARDRLNTLHEQGSVARRKSGRTILWWRTEETPAWREAFGALADTDVPDAMKDQREQLREEWADQ
jgi:DNA-binding IclR family transcriptional regulator